MSQNRTAAGALPSKTGREANEDIPANQVSRVARTLAKGRPATGGGFASLMSDLMLDVLDGSMDAKQANAACNVAQTMLKGIDLDLRLKQQRGDETEDDRRLICDLLASSSPKKPAIIAMELELPRSRVNIAIDHEWFKRTPQGIILAE